MPSDAGQVGEVNRLVSQLLSVVLAEVALAHGVRLANRALRLQLRHGEQLDAVGRAADARAGRRHPLPHRFEIFSDRAHVALHGAPKPDSFKSSRVSASGSPMTLLTLPSTERTNTAPMP